jgi:hypothetical protein
MTTLSEAKAVMLELDTFVKGLIDNKCSTCKQFKTLDNYECFCVEVLDMIDEHSKEPGYDNEVAEVWNRKQRNFLRYHGVG